jgi:hypothetical protein
MSKIEHENEEWKHPDLVTVPTLERPTGENIIEADISFRDQCNSDRFDLADECDDEIQRAERRAGA